MRKFLVVGCGGSGGATLAYMMDQLRSDLADYGVPKIPAAWQFVHIDVPTAPSDVTVGNVRQLGGTYVGTGPQTDNFRVLDNSVSQFLAGNNELATIATWAPRDPGEVTVPISEGAGQYRAIGRMITLSQVGRVKEALTSAWQTLFLSSTDAEMKSMTGRVPGAEAFDTNETPVIFVVSSMAGGAGASMALDICRVLTLIDGLDPLKMGVFMVAPDIFDQLPEGKRTGVRANALAMLGEIVASQAGAAREHDVALLGALGQSRGEGEETPFARVFPVGRYVGAQKAMFGDGSQTAVYRGLGRGLSALMMSAKATRQFVEWDLTNGAGVPGDTEYHGWGSQWSNVPWGAFGFASLSMGRDRYREYAAQRLARSAVELLLTGHKQADNPASDDEQVQALVGQQWPNISTSLGLPASADGGVAGWLMRAVLPRNAAAQIAASIVDGSVRQKVRVQDDIPASQWHDGLSRILIDQRENLLVAARNTAEVEAFKWQQDFVVRLEDTVTAALGDQGLPYATGLVKAVRSTLKDTIVPSGPDLLAHAPGSRIADMEPQTKSKLTSMKGKLASGAQILDTILAGITSAVQTQLYAMLADKVSNAAGALTTEVIDPLVAALDEAQTLLRAVEQAPARDKGLAYLKTDEYSAWPSESDTRVAARFSEADNEVMLTSSVEFGDRYAEHLPQAAGIDVPGLQGLEMAIKSAVSHVITGQWETVVGTKAPADELAVVERITDWWSTVFPHNPETGKTKVAQRARYDVHLRPAEVLARARSYVNRPGYSFERFSSVSLREFVYGTDSSRESELADRHRDIAIKFGETLDLARPLASVNETVMQQLHPKVKQMEYQYKFSAVPFANHPVVDGLKATLGNQPRVDEASKTALEGALVDEHTIKRIDVFGAYPNYSPLAYTAVIPGASQEWASALPSQRNAFWRWRRSRPLPAALPMHQDERRACVAGWIIGRIIGFIQLPSKPYTDPAYVWDAAATCWVPFPNPLLTPPSKFAEAYDWLPSILESSLIAIANCHQPPVMSSMQPYVALRKIYDSTAEGPQEADYGLLELAAVEHLGRFLSTGVTVTGISSVVEGTGPESGGIDGRANKVKEYLQEFGDFAGVHFMKPGQGQLPGRQPGARGGGAFSQIVNRQQASKTPMFHDIAPDVFWATGQLLGLLPAAVEAASSVDLSAPSGAQPPTGGPPPTGPAAVQNIEIPKAPKGMF
ncbi:hypothetical protein FK535_06985 [Mycolicibacterium sp. 018/SC-01/001]|uniref:tubulin-like doman-containing protein n=1 Tax=Mycolicibacterium sp. 018/SC-01/001 TaxID=2592069 RepID=UPI00117D0334|nr:tubulin-like doman-containing protein [Mycolicibacterium sp. 018/SC-01/001]TRW86210.1 hypothetical protein FK535_06985 [Mycolicibacterium sp. 018/SC-01/001]